jgi:transcription elongation factor Elf1
MRCPRCNHVMKNVMHFEETKDYAFHECKYCKQRTHQKRINYEQFEKGNVYKYEKEY